ncbi:hypothetical protein [Ferrimicrobium acidiphilum]|uniref:hypothetical protein n=1 Tax=Ferrimicrobium acidiphilum TaxID=121039 RepID=UPI0023F3885E|nr:hypothetical protein [Ferrimicrobium acidiphilum]
MRRQDIMSTTGHPATQQIQNIEDHPTQEDASVGQHSAEQQKAWSVNTTVQDLKRLKSHPDPFVRQGVACNVNTTSDLTASLAYDPEPSVREAVAWNRVTSPITLAVLAKDQDINIRRATASHPNVRPSTLAILANDEVLSVRKAAKKNAMAANRLTKYDTIDTWAGLDLDDLDPLLAIQPDLLHIVTFLSLGMDKDRQARLVTHDIAKDLSIPRPTVISLLERLALMQLGHARILKFHKNVHPSGLSTYAYSVGTTVPFSRTAKPKDTSPQLKLYVEQTRALLARISPEHWQLILALASTMDSARTVNADLRIIARRTNTDVSTVSVRAGGLIEAKLLSESPPSDVNCRTYHLDDSLPIEIMPQPPRLKSISISTPRFGVASAREVSF